VDDPVLGDLVPIHLGHRHAFAQDRHAVAALSDLLDLGRDQQDTETGVGQLVN